MHIMHHNSVSWQHKPVAWHRMQYFAVSVLKGCCLRYRARQLRRPCGEGRKPTARDGAEEGFRALPIKSRTSRRSGDLLSWTSPCSCAAQVSLVFACFCVAKHCCSEDTLCQAVLSTGSPLCSRMQLCVVFHVANLLSLAEPLCEII